MRNISICLLTCLVMLASAPADIVYLKDGKTYSGEVTRKDGKVYIKTAVANIPVTITVAAADVEKIVDTTSATTPTTETPSTHETSLDTGQTLEGRITRPEALVFLAMQKLARSAAGVGSYDAQQNVKAYQAKAHDGERKVSGRWLSPNNVLAAKEQYLEIIKDTRKIMGDLRRAAHGGSSDQALVVRNRKALAAQYRKAAVLWPDDLMSDFLMGATCLEGLDYIGAQRMFDRCIAAAPRVAAFHQGRSLALYGRKQPLDGLAAALDAIHLQPDSKDALTFLKQSLEATPGDMMTAPTCVLATTIVDLYEQPSRTSTYVRRGTSWLMPGKSITATEYSLPTLPMDRLEFRQAIGVPVGKHALLADKTVLNGALEAFIVIDSKTTVPAQVVRYSSYSYGSKTPLPVTLLYVRDLEFTPLATDGKDKPRKDRAASFYGLNFFEQMGSKIRTVEAKIRSDGGSGDVTLSAELHPGEGAGPVISKSGSLLGFLQGRTDPMVDGGGPGKFVPVAALESLIKRAQRNTSSYGGAKRKVVPKPAAGRYFKICVTTAEYPKKRGH